MSTIDKVMFVFPGQGSQYPRMGEDLYHSFETAKEIFERANDILNYDLVRIAFKDPDNQIGLTRYTQPVLLTHQVACLRVFQEMTTSEVTPVLSAGHSLGEYTALIVAGVLSFEDGLKLVSKRGELMGQYGQGSMLALPLTRDDAQLIAEKHGCQLATMNLLQQTVVGGKDSDIEKLEAAFAELYPRKKAVKLDTEGAFHTDLMKTAALAFKEILEQTSFAPSTMGVVSNYTAELHAGDGSATKNLLFDQLFKPVNWLGCLKTSLSFGIKTIIEFGGGIGKEPEPENKRPNLQSIIKKNFRAFDYPIDYYPAINLKTIEESAKSF
ncbi:MAG: hypothetical protein CMD78_07020 [Gammaproteobacteria bacterium]|nr:hypothetical protein [Gammaproteobacteria bacterium]